MAGRFGQVPVYVDVGSERFEAFRRSFEDVAGRLGLYTITPFDKRSQLLTVQKYGNPKFQAQYEARGPAEWKSDAKSLQTCAWSSEQRFAYRRKLNACPSRFAQIVPPHPHSMFKWPKARRASVDSRPRPPLNVAIDHCRGVPDALRQP